MKTSQSISALVATVGFAAVSVRAQVAGLSTSCQSAATGLISTPFSNCANIPGLVSVVTATGSVVTPVDSWIKGVCSSAPCSQADIDTASASIDTGCSTDLANGVPAALALSIVTANYTLVREVVCLQAISNSTFCLTDFLNAYQTSSGSPVTVSGVSALLGNPASLESTLANVPASDICTDCNHAILTKASALITDSTDASSLSSAASKECGASFADGSVPATVQEASSTTTGTAPAVSSSSLSGAPGRMNLGLGAVVGSALAGGFVMML